MVLLAIIFSFCILLLTTAAITVPTLPFTYSGSTDAAPQDARCTSVINAVYFKINSNYGIYGATIDTCTTNVDTVISLLSDCAALSCNREVDNGCPSGSGSKLTSFDIPASQTIYVQLAQNQWLEIWF